MQALLWWLFAFAVLVLGIEVGRRVSLAHGVRQSGETRDNVKQATSVVATLTALVLGLLIADGQQSFKTQGASIASMAVDVARLDQSLKQYGDGASAARAALRTSVGPVLYALWDRENEASLKAGDRLQNESFIREIIDLPDGTPREALLRDDAYGMAGNLVQKRFGLALLEVSGVPTLLLAILIGWSFIVFTGLGLCSDGSAIGRITSYFGAAAAATAVFLVVEFATPFSGLIQISREPLTLMSAALGETP